jgi:predicted PurR-regulated permease PerM
VPRVISLIVLLVIILMVGAVFFQVMAEFIVPLFLACVLLVVFQPLHARMLLYFPKWPRLAALLTTVLILLVVLLPLTWLGWNAYREGEHAVTLLQSEKGHAFIDNAFAKFGELHKRVTGDDFVRPNNEELLRNTTNYVAPRLLQGAQTVLGMILGLVIMIVALYFFLADGPKMISTIMQISPLEEEHELELLAKFGQISRSVVVATLASAIAQGIVAGIGYTFWLPADAPIFLLTALTMVFAIVPFVGAAGVWVPVALALVLLPTLHEPPEAIGSNWLSVASFVIYCTVIVSGLDNLIKPYVLHGQANLHPLLALLSILGGVKVLGPIGILVGPMLVSFLQALISIFQREMEHWENPQKRAVHKLSPAAEALAESIEAANAEDETQSEQPRAVPAGNKGVKSPKRAPAKPRRRRR